MPLDHYIYTGGKKLRCGYTTGTCAALASAAAVQLLLTGKAPETLSLRTPKGIVVEVPVEDPKRQDHWAQCTVLKDGGDDVDATHGLPIVATAVLQDQPGVQLEGGPGVGRVTRAGLDQPVGEWAINPVPRRMILQAVEEVLEGTECPSGVKITISVPGGEEVARRTFNPLLGIEGGISILGTSGIVEPMSVQALVDTMAIQIRQARQDGATQLILTPGNYGETFCQEHLLPRAGAVQVKCSNFIGECLDQGSAQGFSQILLVGHIGKLVKVAGGIMNTHSKWADCRMELFCAHAAQCGAPYEILRDLMESTTTDRCVELLQGIQLWDEVSRSLLCRMERHLQRRVGDGVATGAIMFSTVHGLLGVSPGAMSWMEEWRG